MIRGGTRPVFILAAAALAALLLTACGGSDSDSSTSGGGSQGQSGGTEEGSQEQRQAARKNPKAYSVEEVSVPLEVSGGGAEQFVVKGGDNSIQEFGEEGDESELEAAARTVHDFYLARATGDWSGACALMSVSLHEQLEQLATKSTEVKGCPTFLEAFTSPLPASSWRKALTIDAGSLRREGEQAFLLYTGAEKAAYGIPLSEEGGGWKVAALSATPLN